MCALFALSLITVRLKALEILKRYQIAELETCEELLLEQIVYLRSEVEREVGGICLLNKAMEFGIQLEMDGLNGKSIPILRPMNQRGPLE